MPVTSFAADDLFIVRTVKKLGANPDRKWANTYELQATVAGSTDELLQAGLAIVDFEKALAMTAVQFDRLLISTWAPDSVPYDPGAFISSALSSSGLRGGQADMQPLTSALSLARVAPSGRFGHIFLRGYLLEDDTSAPAGKSVLTNRTFVQGNVDSAITGSGLDDFIGVGATGGFRIVMVGSSSGQVRPVLGFSVQGVTQLPVDHTWFNRTGPGST